MSARLAVLLFVAPAFAGCISAATDAALVAAGLPPTLDLGYVVHDGTGLRVTPSGELAEPIRAVERLHGQRGAEPNIGVTSSGAVFVTAGHATLRSRDLGKTWEEVFNLSQALPQVPPPVPGLLRVTRSADPMLWVDPLTDRVFTDHMAGLYCSNMFISDDEGETWLSRPMDCGIPVNDHQKVATAPYGPKAPKPPATPVYPNVVYYCYNKLYATHCAVSFDGGLTFPVDRPVVEAGLGPCDGGINGHPAPGPDGTIFVPKNLGCGTVVVGVSEDNGLTWRLSAAPFDVGAEEIDPDVTVTPDGTAYVLWRGDDHLQYLARSTDKFVTWEGPWLVSPPGVRSTVFSVITSGSDGRVAMGYLGTTMSDAYPEDVPNGTKWHLYVTYSLDAASESPTFATTQVTTDADPVQIGCVWLSGGGNPCRNLLDFIDMASDADGRVYVAFTDGCTEACANVPGAMDEVSRSRSGAVAAVVDGPSLRSLPRIRDPE